MSEDGSLNIDGLYSTLFSNIAPEDNPMSPAYIQKKAAEDRIKAEEEAARIQVTPLPPSPQRASQLPPPFRCLSPDRLSHGCCCYCCVSMLSGGGGAYAGGRGSEASR